VFFFGHHRQHTRGKRWIDAGGAPDSPQARALAQHWFQMMQSTFNIEDPAMRAKLQQAMDNEPKLFANTGIDQQMLVFITQAQGTAACPG